MVCLKECFGITKKNKVDDWLLYYYGIGTSMTTTIVENFSSQGELIQNEEIPVFFMQ